MSAAQRILIVVLVIVVAAVGFVVLAPEDEDAGSGATGTAPSATTDGGARTGAAGAALGAARRRAARPRPAAPPVPEIAVRGGEPDGGIRELTLRKGERIRFTVVSDAPDDVHLHGYDVELPVAPGRPARFDVPAEIEGIFEAELHHSGAQIASVTVEP